MCVGGLISAEGDHQRRLNGGNCDVNDFNHKTTKGKKKLLFCFIQNDYNNAEFTRNVLIPQDGRVYIAYSH